jgi:hypothetical protein
MPFGEVVVLGADGRVEYAIRVNGFKERNQE